MVFSDRQGQAGANGSSKELSVNPAETQWGLVDAAVNSLPIFSLKKRGGGGKLHTPNVAVQ